MGDDMYIETERMILRGFKTEDAESLYEIPGDDETMLECEPAYSLEKTEKYLASFCVERVFSAHEKQGFRITGKSSATIRPEGGTILKNAAQ